MLRPRALALAFACVTTVAAQGPVAFEQQVLPLLEEHCFRCHQGVDDRGRERRPKGGLRLDGAEWIRRGGDGGPVLVPGAPDRSSLYRRVILPDDHDDKMPARGQRTSAEDNELLRRWIAAGAEFGDWSGQPGPAESPEAEPAAARPAGVTVLLESARGVAPLPARVIDEVGRDERVRIEPVLPGSPLLRVHFAGREAAVDDAVVSALRPLRDHIAHLDLARTRISDLGLDEVGRMTRLVRLDLRRTSVTDAGMSALSDLRQLRYLNLYGTAVGDRGAVSLEGLAGLRSLYLWDTQVTDDGVERLRAKLPSARIRHRMELPDVAGDPGRRPSRDR